MAEKVTINVDAKTSKARKALEDLNSSLEQVSKTGDKNREGFEVLDKVTGGYAGKIKDLAGSVSGVTKGANAFIKSLKGVKGALLATGIGAVVVALGTIIAYWEDISEFFGAGEKSLQQQADSIKESLGLLDDQLVLLELQMSILEAQGGSTIEMVKEKRKLILLQQEENTLLLEKLSQQLELEKAQVREVSFLDKIKIKAAESLGIYSLAAKERAKAVAGTEEERERLTKLEDDLQKAKERSLKLDLELANLDKKKREDKKKADEDEKKAEKEKADALEKIRQGEIDTEEERRAEERKKIQDHYKELIALAEKYNQDTSALKEAQDTKEKELQDKFDKEDKDRKKAKDEQNKKDLLEEQERKISQLELDKEFDNLTFEEQRALLQAREDILKEDKLLSTKQQEELEQQFADARVKIADLEFKEKQRAMMGYASALGDISGVIGEETEAGKALAVASSLISTYASIAGQLEAFSGVPVPGYAIAQAIATGAVGLANVKKILSTKVPKSSGGGGASAGANVGGATPQAPTFNIVGATETSQLAESIGQQTQEPVQAYVVANDVTTAQSLENNIVEGATL
jgi:hypothetical protein